MMAVVAILCVSSFVACGDDDNSGEQSTGAKVSSFYYSFAISDDVLSIADVKVSYIGTDGEEKSEYMTTTSWEKTFTANKFDVSAGVAISMTLKDGVELTKTSYTIGLTCTYAIKSTLDGKTVDGTANAIKRSTPATPSTAAEILKKRSGSCAFKIDADGQASSTSLSWQDNGVNDDLELIPFV